MKGDTNTKMEQKWEDSRNTRKGKRNKNNKQNEQSYEVTQMQRRIRKKIQTQRMSTRRTKTHRNGKKE